MYRDKQLPLTETTYYILLALVEPAHGYLIMQKVEELSGGGVKLAAGTLYGAIENVLKHEWIQAVKSEEKRRKTYVITDKGMNVLRLDYARMQHMLTITDQVIGEG